jgi:hypothetical protein
MLLKVKESPLDDFEEPAMTSLTLTKKERKAARRLSQRLLADMKAQGGSTSTAATTTISRPTGVRALQGNRFLYNLGQVLPYFTLGGSLALYLTVSAPTLAIGVSLLSAVKLILNRAERSNPLIKRIADKVGRRRYLRLVAGLLFGGFLWNSLNGNAYAQFFGSAEEFFTATFGDAAGETIPIVFGVLRALFLLYIAVSLIRVINAGRNDDDWQQLAKAPLVVVVAVVVADVLTGLVVGA